jgi:hypothetical protein
MDGEGFSLPDQPRFHWPHVPDPITDQEFAELFEWCSLLADAQDLIASVQESDAELKPLGWIR